PSSPPPEAAQAIACCSRRRARPPPGPTDPIRTRARFRRRVRPTPGSGGRPTRGGFRPHPRGAADLVPPPDTATGRYGRVIPRSLRCVHGYAHDGPLDVRPAIDTPSRPSRRLLSECEGPPMLARERGRSASPTGPISRRRAPRLDPARFARWDPPPVQTSRRRGDRLDPPPRRRRSLRHSHSGSTDERRALVWGD